MTYGAMHRPRQAYHQLPEKQVLEFALENRETHSPTVAASFRFSRITVR